MTKPETLIARPLRLVSSASHNGYKIYIANTIIYIGSVVQHEDGTWWAINNDLFMAGETAREAALALWKQVRGKYT